ncbi:hypothetical protein [Aeromicrobium sp. 9AM]|uniref:hypothetical protein n=1 Tax=Aeromicrobium sp. 9AM TaxID=2653126 RepID=UPI0012F289E4|nr:hypothetical protein [Aeromicrobium sp. 9AM]VXB18260.1 conserved exported hypothetical protein [Aeromicrobium sp. 9AM]
MRHHYRSDRPRRVVIALIVVSSLVAVFAGVQLVRGDDASNEVSSAPLKRDLGSPDDDFASSDDDTVPTDKESPTSDDPVVATLGGNQLLSPSDDVYANPQGPVRRLRVTLTLKSDGPLYEAYDFRDGKRGGPSVIGKTLTVTRTLYGPPPVARLVAQVMINATYVTCRITIDGVVVAQDTARGPGYVSACQG